jgi:hypothetical protein
MALRATLSRLAPLRDFSQLSKLITINPLMSKEIFPPTQTSNYKSFDVERDFFRLPRLVITNFLRVRLWHSVPRYRAWRLCVIFPSYPS